MKSILLVISIIGISTSVMAGVSSSEKLAVQTAMKKYVKQSTQGNNILPVSYNGKILELELKTSKTYPDGFHTGVQKDGTLYASCADFVVRGTKTPVDVDFLVKKIGSNYQVIQPIVHSFNGKKNPYDLDH